METTSQTEHAAPVYPFALPPLPYAYDALEPYMDAKTLEIHHGKHHAAYVAALNVLLADQPQLHNLSIEDLLRQLDTVPETIRDKVAFNAGGHANHQFFWKILKPGPATQPQGNLKTALEKAFGDIETFKKQFHQAVIAVQGSGWVFLVVEPEDDGALVIRSTKNHESVLPRGAPGLLICDVWEHAYYLKHQNRRVDYMAAYWELVDWDKVATRLDEVHAGKQL